MEGLAGAEGEFAEVFAAGESLDALEDEFAVEKEFLADDLVGDGDEDAAFVFDVEEVGVLDVGRADYLFPVLHDGVFPRRHSDAIFFHDVLNEFSDGSGFAKL